MLPNISAIVSAVAIPKKCLELLLQTLHNLTQASPAQLIPFPIHGFHAECTSTVNLNLIQSLYI